MTERQNNTPTGELPGRAARGNDRKKSTRGGKRPGAGRPKGSKKQYNILDYTTAADLKLALKVLIDKHIRANKDRHAAEFLIDQLCGTAVNRRETVGDGKNTGPQFILVLPPKYSELAIQAQAVEASAQVLDGSPGLDLPPKDSAKMKDSSGKTPTRAVKAG